MKTKIFTLLLFTFSLSALAQPQWLKKAGSAEGYEHGNAIATDASGNLYITGQIEFSTVFEGGTTLNASGGHDVFVAKYDPSGSLIWAKKAGGRTGDVGRAIGLDNAGNIYITGEFEDTISFGTFMLTGADTIGAMEDHNEIFVAKYSNNGDFLWAKAAGGPWHEKGQGLVVEPVSGDFYVTGYFTGHGNFGGPKLSGFGGPDIFLTKYNTNGDYQWAKIMGGSGQDEGRGIYLDAAGFLYLTGTFEGIVSNIKSGTTLTSAGGLDIFVAKFDASGNALWVQSAGGPKNDQGRAIAVDPTGFVYITGESWEAPSFGGNVQPARGWLDAFIAKYDMNGNLVWVKVEGGNMRDAGRGIAVTATHIYVTGDFSTTGNFGNMQVGSYAGELDMFLAKYDLDGNILGVQRGGGWHEDAGRGVVLDASGNVYVTGYFREAADFTWQTYQSAGLTDIFLAKFGNNIITSVEDQASEVNFSVYPNPSIGIYHITLNENSLVQVFDVTGQLLNSIKVNANDVETLDLSVFSSGIYFCKMQNEKSSKTIKLIKE